MSWYELERPRFVIPSGRWGGWARNPLPEIENRSVGRGFLAHPPPRPLGMTGGGLALRVPSCSPSRVDGSFHSLITGLCDVDPRSHATRDCPHSLDVERLLPRASQRGRRCRRRMRGRLTGDTSVGAGSAACMRLARRRFVLVPEERVGRMQVPPHPPSPPSAEKRGGRRRSIGGRRESVQERVRAICGGQTL